MSVPKLKHPFIIWGIFFLGLFCTVAFRSFTILNQTFPDLVRPIWYAGVLGYLVFFLFRFRISIKRRQAIQKYSLLEAVSNDTYLSDEQKQVTLYLLNSIMKSKENLNYFAIFIFSALAVGIDLFLVFSNT